MLSRIMKYFVLFFIFLPLYATSQSFGKYGIDEDEEIPMGKSVGDSAYLFELKDESGKTVSLKSELVNGPVVLLFYRGEWCPVCIRYLSAMQDSLSLITETGATLLAVTGETSKNAQKTKEKTESTFPLLLDRQEIVMKEYDVLFDVTAYYNNKVKVGHLKSVAANNGQEESRLPIPATYIIDTSGIIIFRHFEYNYKTRASVKMIVSALETL